MLRLKLKIYIATSVCTADVTLMAAKCPSLWRFKANSETSFSMFSCKIVFSHLRSLYPCSLKKRNRELLMHVAILDKKQSNNVAVYKKLNLQCKQVNVDSIGFL